MQHSDCPGDRDDTGFHHLIILAPIATCISLGDLTLEWPYDLTGITKGEHPIGDVGSNDAPHPNEAIGANGHPIAHHGSATNGRTVSDHTGSGEDDPGVDITIGPNAVMMTDLATSLDGSAEANLSSRTNDAHRFDEGPHVDDRAAGHVGGGMDDPEMIGGLQTVGMAKIFNNALFVPGAGRTEAAGTFR